MTLTWCLLILALAGAIGTAWLVIDEARKDWPEELLARQQPSVRLHRRN